MKNKRLAKKEVVYSPLLRFRMRARCQDCALRDACKVDKNLELTCILALIADSLDRNSRLNSLRGAHL